MTASAHMERRAHEYDHSTACEQRTGYVQHRWVLPFTRHLKVVFLQAAEERQSTGDFQAGLTETYHLGGCGSMACRNEPGDCVMMTKDGKISLDKELLARLLTL